MNKLSEFKKVSYFELFFQKILKFIFYLSGRYHVLRKNA